MGAPAADSKKKRDLREYKVTVWVTVDAAKIADAETLEEVFAEAFGSHESRGIEDTVDYQAELIGPVKDD